MIQHKLKCKFVKEDTQEIGESTSLWSPFRPLHRVFMLFFCHPKWGWAYWHCTDFWSVWCLLAETDQDQKGARGNFLRFFLLNVGIAPHQSKPPSLHNWLYILHRWHLSTFQNPCLMNCLALGLGQVIISFICIVKTLSCVRMRKVYEVNMWETVSFFRSARKVWNDRTWWHN